MIFIYYTASKLFWNQGSNNEINMLHTQVTAPAVGALSNVNQPVVLVTPLSLNRYTQNTMQHLFCPFFWLVCWLIPVITRFMTGRLFCFLYMCAWTSTRKILISTGDIFCCYWIKWLVCVSLCWSMTIHSLILNIISNEQLNCKWYSV